MRQKKLSAKTIIFLSFMMLFFVMAGYLTYYSKVVYLNNLPVYEMIKPQITEEYHNGRATYLIPKNALHKDETTGKYYIFVARRTNDVLGERYLVTQINVWLLEEKEEIVRVDGIVWEDPILIVEEGQVKEGQAVKYN